MLKGQRRLWNVESFVSLAHTFFLALLKLAFISEIFYCKSLLIVFRLDLLFFSFFFLLSIGLDLCFILFVSFQRFYFLSHSQLYPDCYLEMKNSLLNYFTYTLFSPADSLSLPQGIGSSYFLCSSPRPAWRNAYTQVSVINSRVLYSQLLQIWLVFQHLCILSCRSCRISAFAFNIIQWLGIFSL